MGDKKDKKETKEVPKTEESPTPKDSPKDAVEKEIPPKPRDDSQVENEEDEEITLGAAVAGFSSWFTSTMSTAKEKSTEMFQYLKQDFTEFSETVSEASKDFKDKLKLEDTAKTAVQTVASKASIVLDQMSTIFGVGPDDDDEALVMNSSGAIVIDRVKSKLHTMTVDEDVFLKDPADIKAYENWILQFDLEKKNEEMSDLMTANPHLQLRYAQLVPQKVSHLVFWHRFYYHVHELYLVVAEEEKELARKKALAKKAAAEAKESDSDICMIRNDDSPTGSDPSLVDISEEDQKRLLAEYEEEMKNSSAQHSRRSSGTQLSSSSSGSFAIVTHDAATDEVKVE